jgi:hypothetical protein
MPTLQLPTGPIEVSCPTGQVSDGYHTFGELYDHRCLLFLALMKAHPTLAWRARLHDDGSTEPGWWAGGMHLPTGDVSYHLPDALWALLEGTGVATLERAPKWDGHTSAEVLSRIRKWLEAPPESPYGSHG